MRSRLPAVTVIDVPEDPALYVAALDSANLFDTVSVTSEDRARGEFFHQNHARERLESGSADYAEFLRRLEMRAIVEPIDQHHLTRAVQLINKTSQFNLTVRRMTEAEVETFAQHTDAYTSTVRLQDKFGSYGLISVVMGWVTGDTLHLENWVMSCRVFKRGVELLEMERLLAFCKARGLRNIVARYVATPRNKLVIRHLEELGFVPALSGEDAIWHFALDVQNAKCAHAIAT